MYIKNHNIGVVVANISTFWKENRWLLPQSLLECPSQPGTGRRESTLGAGRYIESLEYIHEANVLPFSDVDGRTSRTGFESRLGTTDVGGCSRKTAAISPVISPTQGKPFCPPAERLKREALEYGKMKMM